MNAASKLIAAVFILVMLAIGLASTCDRLVGRPAPDIRLFAAMANRNMSEFDSELAAGTADWARTTCDSTPLIVAAFQGETGMARKLIARGADVNAEDRFGNTALICAAGGDHVEMVDLLLGAHADPSHRNSFNRSALEVAIDMEAERAMQVLSRVRQPGAAPDFLDRQNVSSMVVDHQH